MPIYMRITDNGLPIINGDATAKGHEKWIELSSIKPGRPAYIAPRKRFTREESLAPIISEMVISKVIDSASSALIRQSSNGKGVTIQIDLVKYRTLF
jgi:type VI secretion system secreted protein Hcp